MQVLILQDLDKCLVSSVDVVPHPYREKVMGLLLGTGGISGHGLLKISAKRLKTQDCVQGKLHMLWSNVGGSELAMV